MKTTQTIAILAAACAAGCFSVKTESEVKPIEVKPIHITMDIILNVKVNKELDKAFADENQQKPQGNFVAVKDMLDRKAAVITNKALLIAHENTGAMYLEHAMQNLSAIFPIISVSLFGTASSSTHWVILGM